MPLERTSWPYLRTPQGLYWLVMGPICGLQLFLLATRTPTWIKTSAAVVILLTLSGYVRGYVRRLVVDPDAATMKTLLSRRVLPWPRIRRVDVYTPGGGLGSTRYVYLTAHDRPPDGKWEIDADTFQVQERPGLLAALQDRWRQAQTTVAPVSNR